MEYKGKLYGHLGGKMYFDTGKTADDWDALEKRVAELEAENQALRQPLVSGSLPSLDDATKVAVRISEEAITPPLDAKEQAMFIAGFQECIKWLNVVFGNDR